MKLSQPNKYDIAGIGIGPSNLSMAALLLKNKRHISSCFYDRVKTFNWHAGMLFPEATIQVSHLKDLVTLVDPTNPLTFLAFLKEKKRLYRFLAADFDAVKRREFNQYFQWVCTKLDNLTFGTNIHEVSYNGQHFTLFYDGGETIANNISIACGLTPFLPDFARPHKCETVFHVANYMDSATSLKGKRVVLVGGGQSGAETFSRIISARDDMPQQTHWVTRRPNFLPIDDTPFTNDFYSPGYSDYFFAKPFDEQQQLNVQQTLTSDGIDEHILKAIYQRLYEIDHVDGLKGCYNLSFSSSTEDLRRASNCWEVIVDTPEGKRVVKADIVIFATGFRNNFPPFLNNLRERISLHKNLFAFNSDFSVDWEGNKNNKIYVHNAARHVRGVADPNLSLIAWRSAKIINSLAGHQVYDIDEESSPFNWNSRVQPAMHIPIIQTI
jgi:lysine N6-hydroxylase